MVRNGSYADGNHARAFAARVVARVGSKIALVAIIVGAGACTRTIVQAPPEIRASNAPTPTANVTGGATPRGAVEAFLVSVKASDLQGMSGVWGTSRGAARDFMKRDEMEKRLVVLQCVLMHDKWRYLEDTPRLEAGGHQKFRLELTRKSSTAATAFSTVSGPDGRWFVDDIDLVPLKDFCR